MRYTKDELFLDLEMKEGSLDDFAFIVGVMEKQNRDRFERCRDALRCAKRIDDSVFRDLLMCMESDFRGVMQFFVGYRIDNAVKSFFDICRMLISYGQDFFRMISVAEAAVRERTAFEDADFLENLTFSVQKILFGYCGCVSAAEERLYLMAKLCENAEISDFFEKNIKSSDRYHFIKRIRNIISHGAFIESNWEIIHASNGDYVDFFVYANSIPMDRLNQQAKQYIEKSGKRISLREVISGHTNTIVKYYGELNRYIALNMHDSHEDYLARKDEREKYLSRQSQALLQQMKRK